MFGILYRSQELIRIHQILIVCLKSEGMAAQLKNEKCMIPGCRVVTGVDNEIKLRD